VLKEQMAVVEGLPTARILGVAREHWREGEQLTESGEENKWRMQTEKVI